MIGRYFLLFLGVVSLVWIGYVGSDLIDKKHQFSPSHIFGKEDGRVLIINRLNECSISDLSFTIQPESNKLFSSILPYLNNSKIIILSELQNQMLFQRTDDWDKEKIISFFKKANLSVDFNSRHGFVVGEFEGKFNFSVLYLGMKNVKKPLKENEEWLKYDDKSSASIVLFKPKSISITDIYVKSTNQIQYVSKKFYSKHDKQIDDEELFSVALPSDLINYHFFEKNYYSSIYKKFNQSPLFEWIDNGFVQFEYKGHMVIVSDYKSGQDPILLLNDKVGESSSSELNDHFKNIQLTKKFPESLSLGFYIKMMDDFVVVSTSQSVCEQVIADYKLGNTMAMKKGQGESFFKELPKKVSERYISDVKIFSNSNYRNRLLKTELIVRNARQTLPTEKIVEKEKTISLFVGGEIQDFMTFKGKGNLVSLSKDGQLSMYQDGKKIWVKELGSKAIGTIQSIDFNSNGEKVFLCTSKNQIHLINKAGNELSGFPINVDGQVSNEATFYRWNNSSNIAFITDKSEMIVFDSKGKKISSFKTGLTNVNAKIDVWVSNNILLACTKDSKQSVLFDLNKKREHRRFQIEEKSFSLKKGNELFLYTIKNNQLISIDQKGNRKNISTFNSGNIISVLSYADNSTIVIRSKNDLHFLNESGIEFKSLHLSFSEIDDVFIFKSSSDVTYISVLDGVANNIYVYNLNGELINKTPFDGKIKSNLNLSSSNELVITSIVDDYVVQYLLSLP